MKNFRRTPVLLAFFGLFLVILAQSVEGSQPLVLFDEGHAQTAGNADWVINGAYSDFAAVFAAQGCEVRAIKNLQWENIKDAAIIVLPEPNSVYSPQEEAAIVRFVMNGGGLYAIADHKGSDRNGDGIDSIGVLNRFLPQLGLEIDKRSFTEAPVTGQYLKTPITEGVKSVGTWGGTSVKCLASTAVAHITVSPKNGGGAYIATNIVGTKGGRVVAMGDSSPYDDGTGNPSDHLYDGFNNPGYSHARLAQNTVKWLLEKQNINPRKQLQLLIADAAKSIPQDDDSALMYRDAARNTISYLLNEYPELRNEAREVTSGIQELSGLASMLDNQDRFELLHQPHP